MIIKILNLYPFFASTVILLLGLYIIIVKKNYLQKLIGLMVFQSGNIFLYMAVSKITGGSFAIISSKVQAYSNPIPHVLMLTAIVVGISIVSVACAILVRIYLEYNTLEITDINLQDNDTTIIKELIKIFVINNKEDLK